MRDDGDRMTPPSATDRPERDNPGVLGSLPSTRPQRPSARRAKARAKRGTTTPTEPATNARPRRAAKPKPKPVEPPVPPQGFEAEEQIEPGRAVQPPSNTELAASVAELFGELAQAGLSTGERLVKDALRRLTGD